MEQILILFNEKYEGNWDLVYQAIKDSEYQKINLEKLNSVKNDRINIMTILDEKYPNKFKNIYMPPFILFHKGDINLINKQVIAIWGDVGYEYFLKNKLSKNIIYSFNWNIKNHLTAKKLVNYGYKIILVDKNGYKKSTINNIDSNNILYLCEMPKNVKINENYPELQKINRLLNAVSDKVLLLNANEKTVLECEKIAKFENKQMYSFENESIFSKDVKIINSFNEIW